MLTKEENERLRIITRLYHRCSLNTLKQIERSLTKKPKKKK